MQTTLPILSGLLGLLFLCGCATTRTPLPTVDKVDIDRFMGDWYVIAGLFTPFEKEVHNAVETYERKDDGSIATTFRYRKGGFDGPIKTFHPTGFIYDEETKAEWRMQFIWPFKAAYLVIYLDDDYQHTAIGVPSRKYLWIMSRDWNVPEDDMARILRRVEELGYATNKIEYVPHQWPE